MNAAEFQFIEFWGPKPLRRIRAAGVFIRVVVSLIVFGTASLTFAAPTAGQIDPLNPLGVKAVPTPAGPSTNSNSITNVSSPAFTNSMDTLDDKHLLAIGDRISFRIVEDEDDPKELVVTDSGDLEVPYIGRYPAEGKSCKQLAAALKIELQKDYYYQATVILAVDAMARSHGNVYLAGAIRTPGPLELPGDEVLTLSKAVLRMGGFTDYADERNVKVTRKRKSPPGDDSSPGSGKKDETFSVNVADVLEKGKTDGDLPLEPGDLIYVPERVVRF